ncbi:MAG TPA: HNH endonuclease [Candidatus Sulfotelmatobacter sp.]|nr:HNH endonuclease [Candidatus Sulfotelmatobacter sp.]
MSDVLLLNFTYEPLAVIGVRRAVRLVFTRKAEVVFAGEDELRSPTVAFPLPSIVRLLFSVARRRRRLALTKMNVLLRDDYRCGYCGVRCGAGSASVDHVVPKSRGGRSAWDNLVTCCLACNGRKGDRTPDEARMPLRRIPREPRSIPWIVVRRHTLPDEWWKYLFLYSVDVVERPVRHG